MRSLFVYHIYLFIQSLIYSFTYFFVYLLLLTSPSTFFFLIGTRIWSRWRKSRYHYISFYRRFSWTVEIPYKSEHGRDHHKICKWNLWLYPKWSSDEQCLTRHFRPSRKYSENAAFLNEIISLSSNNILESFAFKPQLRVESLLLSFFLKICFKLPLNWTVTLNIHILMEKQS